MEESLQKIKIKRMLKSLDDMKGNGTSMITLILPPKSSINMARDKLVEEKGKASNVKSRVNRLSILTAIESTLITLKSYNKVPENGLVIFCGIATLNDGREKKIRIDFEPYKPLNTSKYECDNKFHTEYLDSLLHDDNCYGFIIVDGNGCLYGTVSGNNKNIIHKFSVSLPGKTRRGGQSALRFDRIREEKKYIYLKKVGELSTQFFISKDLPNVKGLVLAGAANFKNDLVESKIFDDRLKKIVLDVVDVSYGDENGFNQAINLSQHVLGGVELLNEKKILSQFFTNIEKDSGKYCYCLNATMKALEMGAIELLIIWENLNSIVYKVQSGNDIKYIFDGKIDENSTVLEQESFIDWIMIHYKDYGANLVIVSDNTEEGNQFVKGFGGIGGILRYKVEMTMLDDDIDFEENNDFDDFL